MARYKIPTDRRSPFWGAVGLGCLAWYWTWRLGAGMPATGVPDWFGQSWLFVEALLSAYMGLLLLYQLVPQRWAAHPEEVAANPQVDVFVPTYGEPPQLLEACIRSLISNDYAHFTIWVGDDGGRQWVKDLCDHYGVQYLSRAFPKGQKNGKSHNLNYMMAHTKADVVAVVDADCFVAPDFISRTVVALQENGGGMVQVGRSFYTPDPLQFIGRLAGLDLPPDSAFFERFLLPLFSHMGFANCAGTGFMITRNALEAAGGFDVKALIEDVSLSVAVRRKGFATGLLDKPLIKGIAAEGVLAMQVQRNRWCRGGVARMWSKYGPFGIGVRGFVERLVAFETPLYWLGIYTCRALFPIAGIVVAWTGWVPVGGNFSSFTGHWMPAAVVCSGLLWATSGWTVGPLYRLLSEAPLAPMLAFNAWGALLSPLPMVFKPTPKITHRRGWTVHAGIFMWHGFGLATLAGGVLGTWSVLTPMAWLWVALSALFFAVGLGFSMEPPQRRAEPRFKISGHVRVCVGTECYPLELCDLSPSGARVKGIALPLADNTRTISLEMDDVGAIPAQMLDARHGMMRMKLVPDAHQLGAIWHKLLSQNDAVGQFA